MPPSSLRARSQTFRISATLETTPEQRTKLRFVALAMTSARVVLPQPGGPYKIMFVRRSASMTRRRSLPGPSMWLCPTTSSSVRGRIRAAKGSVSYVSTPLLYHINGHIVHGTHELAPIGFYKFFTIFPLYNLFVHGVFCSRNSGAEDTRCKNNVGPRPYTAKA